MNIPEAICRQQAIRESLFKLGFTDDQVKLCFGGTIVDSTTGKAFHHRGHEEPVTLELHLTPESPERGEFRITCGFAPKTWTQNFPRVASTWNALTYAERSANYEKHQPLHEFLALIEALSTKGIAMPELVKHQKEEGSRA